MSDNTAAQVVMAYIGLPADTTKHAAFAFKCPFILQ